MQDQDKELAALKARISAVTKWLEANQPDVFRRGLWDAINDAEKARPSPAVDLSGLTRYDYNHARDMMERAAEGDFYRVEDVWAALSAPASAQEGKVCPDCGDTGIGCKACDAASYPAQEGKGGLRHLPPSELMVEAADALNAANWRGDLQEQLRTLASDLNAIYDLFQIGTHARTIGTLMTNIRNMMHFADLLHAVEREFFMAPGEPDEDFPDAEPDDECLVNSWGSTAEQYLEQFRAALSKITATQERVERATVPEGFVLVPKALTAENGAKAALIGEFSEAIQMHCPDCDDGDEDCGSCATCEGSGNVSHVVPIGWSSIKAIYARAVEVLAAASVAQEGKEADGVQGLISVLERLPECIHECTTSGTMVSNTVLVYGESEFGTKGHGFGHLQDTGNWVCYDAEYDQIKVAEVTHWGPLPKPSTTQQDSAQVDAKGGRDA